MNQIDSTGAPMPAKNHRADYDTRKNVLLQRDPKNLPKYKKATPTEMAVWDYLAGASISVDIAGNGATKLGEWECDAWTVTFHKDTRANPAKPYASEAFKYHTGTGHRELTAAGRDGLVQARKLNPRCTAYAYWSATAYAASCPHFAGILHSLLLDATADDTSFTNWCEDCGYDSDSRKALDIYTQCCESAKQLRNVFTRQQLEDLRELLQDY